jgi:hypothetical protein
MLEVVLDPLGLALDAAQVPCCSLHELLLRPRRCELRHRLLQVGVDYLVRVQTEAVAEQAEDLDPF